MTVTEEWLQAGGLADTADTKKYLLSQCILLLSLYQWWEEPGLSLKNGWRLEDWQIQETLSNNYYPSVSCCCHCISCGRSKDCH